MALAEKIKKCAEEYMSHDDYMKNMEVPVLTVDFVIEQAKRRYPKSYSSEKKEQLLEDEYVNLLGMMVVDCLAHYGAEGEKQHTEKNISRISVGLHFTGFAGSAAELCGHTLLAACA